MTRQPRPRCPRRTNRPRGAWTIALLASTLASPSLLAHDDPELVAHLAFEGSPTDSSGHGNPGQLAGTPGVYVPPSVHGQANLGMAIDLDGMNDEIQLDAVADDFAGAGHVSLALWVQATSGGGIASVESAGGTSRVAVSIAGDGRVAVSVGGTLAAQSIHTIADGQWHHVAIAIDATGAESGVLFVDGAIDQMFSHPPFSLTVSDRYALGRAGALHLDGLLDDARLFHGLLDLADVSGIKGHPDDGPKQDEHTLLFALVPVADASHVTTASGAWSSAATWNGGAIPGDGARVVIAAGTTVTYDVDNIIDELHWLRVDGSLHFATTVDTTLRVDTLVVDPAGTLTLGTAATPVMPDVAARIVINSDGAIDRDWDPAELSRGVISHGTFHAHGAVKTPWATLPSAMAGATTLHLDAAPTGWRLGDTLVLAGTYATYAGDDDDNTRFHDEVLRVTAINGSAIAFENITNAASIGVGSTALLWDHAPPAGYGLRVHVANLTRNVVIETEDVAQLSDVKRRGHVMLMHSDKVDVRYLASIGNGRTDKSQLLNDSQLDDGSLTPGTGTNQRGRYALHLHRLGPNKPTPVSIVGNAVVTSPGWGIVHHDSHADVTDNVAFDVDGAAFVLEDGTERGSMRRNLSIKNRGDGDPDMDIEISPRTPLFDLGFNGHGFWIQGGGGPELTDNISASAFGTAFFVHSNDDLLPGPTHPNVVSGLLTAQPKSIPTQYLSDPAIAGSADEVSVAAIPLRRLSGLVAYNANRGLMSWMHMRNGDGVGSFSLPEAAAFPHNFRSVVEDFQFFALRLNGINHSYTSQITYRDGLILGDVDTQLPRQGWPADRLENGYAFPAGQVRPAIIGNQSSGDQMTFENLRIEGWTLGLMVPHTGPEYTMAYDVSYVASRLVGGYFDRNGQHLFPQTTGTSNAQQAYWVREFTPYFQVEGSPYFGATPANTAPVATWTHDAVGGLSVAFDGSGSVDADAVGGGSGVDTGNGIAAYRWDFGDGSPLGFGRDPVHIYATPGTYPVVLTVFDKQGATASHGATISVAPSDYPDLIRGGDFSDPTSFPSYAQWEFGDGSVLIAELGGDWTTTEGSSIARVNGRAEVIGPIGSASYQRQFIHQLHQDDHVRRGPQRLRFHATNVGPGAANTTLEVIVQGVDGEFRLPYVPATPVTPWKNGDDSFGVDVLLSEDFGGAAIDATVERTVDFGDGYQFVVVTFLFGDVAPATGQVVAIDDVELTGAGAAQTILQSMFVTPEPMAATLHFATISEGAATGYRVEIKPSDAASFATVAELPALGAPHEYEVHAAGLTAGTSYLMRLSEVLPDQGAIVLGSTSVTPLAAGDPANVLTVGPTGAYSTIQAAINAAVAEGTVIRVAPGMYPAFSIGAVPSGGLRIVGEPGVSPGAGVFVDTTVAPVEIHDLPLGAVVEINELVIGSLESPNDAITIRDCEALVILDEIDARAGADRVSIRVDRSRHVVTQRSSLSATNDQTLDVAQQSSVTISASTAAQVAVSGASQLTHCALAATDLSIEAGSTATSFAGIMPEIDLPELIAVSTGLAVSFHGDAHASWLLVAGDRFADATIPGVEMPLLLTLGSARILYTGVAGAAGTDEFGVFIPPLAALVGLTFAFQGARVSPTTGAVRLTNAEGLTLLP